MEPEGCELDVPREDHLDEPLNLHFKTADDRVPPRKSFHRKLTVRESVREYDLLEQLEQPISKSKVIRGKEGSESPDRAVTLMRQMTNNSVLSENRYDLKHRSSRNQNDEKLIRKLRTHKLILGSKD